MFKGPHPEFFVCHGPSRPVELGAKGFLSLVPAATANRNKVHAHASGLPAAWDDAHQVGSALPF